MIFFFCVSSLFNCLGGEYGGLRVQGLISLVDCTEEVGGMTPDFDLFFSLFCLFFVLSVLFFVCLYV
jgi:hypothetical protein